MKIRNLTLILITLFAVVGCFKDKGNYEYVTIPQYKLVSPSLPAILMGEKILITPKIIFSEGENYEFDYEWRINEVVVANSNTASYEYTGHEIGRHSVGVTLTEKKTGAKKFLSTTVTVASMFENGFLLLVDDNNNTDMHFIRSSRIFGTYQVSNDTLLFVDKYNNIHKNMLGGVIEGTPEQMEEHWMWESDQSGEISLKTKVNGKYQFTDFNGQTMKRETFVEQEFINGELPANFSPQKMVHSCWDSFILDENGSVFSRRSSTSLGFHTGFFDKNIKLWGDAKFADVFFGFYGNSHMFLALEVDPVTKQKNFVGIYESGGKSSANILMETLSSKRLPQLPVNPEYSNFKGEILFTDFFKGFRSETTVQPFIIRNESNELILQMAHYRNVNKSNLDFTMTSKLNLTSQYSISKVKGMFTSKTEYDRVVYLYDDSKMYSIVYNPDNGVFVCNVMLEFKDKSIVSAAGHSLGLSRGDDAEYDLVQMEAHVGIAFSDGSFVIYELDNIDPSRVTKIVYECKENLGKIKQVIYKVGDDSDFVY